MHFNAEIDEETEEITMSVEWNTSIKVAVEVLFASAMKHHQIRTAIEMVYTVLQKDAPLTEEESKDQMLKTMFENMFEDDTEGQEILQKIMAQGKSQGDA
jgi:acyl-CoA hydrolase